MVRLSGLLLVSFLLLSGCATTSVDRANALMAKQHEAIALYQAKDFKRAARVYLELTEELSQDLDNWLKLGNCYAHLKLYDEAEAAYREVLIRDTSHVKAWYNITYIQAEKLARTVVDMSRAVDKSTPEIITINKLAIDVLKPFGMEIPGAVPSTVSSTTEVISNSDVIILPVDISASTATRINHDPVATAEIKQEPESEPEPEPIISKTEVSEEVGVLESVGNFFDDL